jgi:hypothetical protein
MDGLVNPPAMAEPVETSCDERPDRLLEDSVKRPLPPPEVSSRPRPPESSRVSCSRRDFREASMPKRHFVVNLTFGTLAAIGALAAVLLLGGGSRHAVAHAGGGVRAATARAATQGYMARAQVVQHGRVARVTTHVLRGDRRALAGRRVTVRVTAHGHARLTACGRTGRHGAARCRVRRARGARLTVLVKASGGHSLRVRVKPARHHKR